MLLSADSRKSEQGDVHLRRFARRTIVLLLVVAPPAWGESVPEDRRIAALAEARCQRCHGPHGNSSTTAFPKLAGQNPAYLVKQMFNFAAGVRPAVVMQEALHGLSGPDLEDLARYYGRQHVGPEPITDGAAVTRGMVVYHGAGKKGGASACVSCHGPYARGGQMLPRLAGQHATYLEQSLLRFVGRQRPATQPGMHASVDKLSLSQIRDVAHYLASIE